MRMKHIVPLLLAGGLLATSFLWSQGPGGGSDPDALFDRISGGKDVIARADLEARKDASDLRVFDRWALQLNVTDGRISRDQYHQVMAEWSQMRATGGGAGCRPGLGPARTRRRRPRLRAWLPGPRHNHAGGRWRRGQWGWDARRPEPRHDHPPRRPRRHHA